MSYVRIILLPLFLGLTSVTAYAENQRATCESLLENSESITVALFNSLGNWENCATIQNDPDAHYNKQTLVANWKNVTLTVKFSLPDNEIHSGIYIVETTHQSPLSAAWFKNVKKNYLSYFEMRWEDDLFLGPSAEYYVSKSSGNNGQIWLERDESNAIKWMRFSYIY